ncbi:MAG: S1C family serine protease [Anaerolineales bacterium]
MKRKYLIVLLAALVGASLACSSSLLDSSTTPTSPRAIPPFTNLPSTSPPATQEAEAVPQSNFAAIYQQANPGVVNILTFPANSAAGSLPLGQGSGFVINSEGYIVTNQHVVADGDEIEVDFSSGLKAWAELIGTDPDSDLAVLKVNVAAELLHPLPLGDSSRIQVGDTVVAIGNPFGLNSTMTVGIVSAVGRTLDSERAAPTGGAFTAGDIIQTDAAINPGNSGGPLINLQGEVIGVNRAIRTEATTTTGSPANSGIGFAVPVNIVRQVVPALIEQGEYQYPFLGVSSLSEDAWNLKTVEALDLPADASGAYVTCVTPGGPADQAGLQGAADCDELGLRPGGDLITAIEGDPVRAFSDLLSYLINNTRPGDTVTLTVLRNGESLQIDVVLESRN